MSTVAADRAETSALKYILFAYTSIMFGCTIAAYGILGSLLG